MLAYPANYPSFPDCVEGVTSGVDIDGDGWDDACDNCPNIFQYTQADTDGDGTGDACDLKPVLLMYMDEGTGQPYDSSASQNHGTRMPSTGPPAWVNGAAGFALSFDGADDLVALDRPLTLRKEGATVAWWLKPQDATSTGLFSKNSTGSTLSHIEIRSDMIFAETQTNCNTFNFHDVPKPTEWSFYTLVFKDSKAYLYMDGGLLKEADDYGYDACGGNAVTQMLNDTILQYLGTSTAYNPHYKGIIDELLVYDRALSSSEVADIYHRYDFDGDGITWTEKELCWRKRRKVDIQDFQPDFQVALHIDTTQYPGMREDLRDIRFYDATAGRALPHWVEGISNSVATVWFRTGDNNDIYLYYDNPGLTNTVATDQFEGSSISSQWGQLRPPDNGWGVSDGRLYINIDPDEDLYKDLANNAPLLYIDAPSSSFEVTVKVEGDFTENYAQGALLVYQDDDHYIKLIFGYVNGKKVQFAKEDGASSFTFDQVAVPSSTSSVHLKLRNSGGVYTAYYSLDGQRWNKLRGSFTASYASAVVGLSAFSLSSATPTAYFDDFVLSKISPDVGNADTVFEFFDDFSNFNASKWPSASGTYSTGAGILRMQGDTDLHSAMLKLPFAAHYRVKYRENG